MRILVTGAIGFMGFHLVQRLAAAGHQVLGTARVLKDGSPDSARRLGLLQRSVFWNSPRLKIVALEQRAGLAALVRDFKPQACVHLAGRSAVRQSIAEPLAFVDSNYVYTAELLETLRQHDCRKLVHASTVMVYGKDAALPYEEERTGSAPASPYGATKAACEIMVNTYSQLHQMENSNLRFFSVYGPELRPDCVPFLIGAAILRGTPFSVFGDGSSVRDYVEIQDALDAVEAALVHPGPLAAVNIGSGQGTRLIDLIRMMEHYLGRRAKLEFKPAIPGELLAAVPSIARAEATLKWHPATKIESGIERLAAWLRGSDSPLQ